jgi:hypothetical protein
VVAANSNNIDTDLEYDFTLLNDDEDESAPIIEPPEKRLRPVEPDPTAASGVDLSSLRDWEHFAAPFESSELVSVFSNFILFL